MSTEYKNIVQFFKVKNRSGEEKTRAVNLGTAVFKGDNIYLKFDALPVPRENNFGELTVEASIVEPRDRGGFNQPQDSGSDEPSGGGDSGDIPF